ncbi:MAG: RNA polymerase sigma factor [Phycisphaerales bacterium]
MSSICDEHVRQAVRGDDAILADLLEQAGPVVRAAIAPSIPSRHASVLDVDDVMQVTYIEAFLHVQTLRHETGGGFVAWLRQIAVNNVRDAARMLDAACRTPRRVTQQRSGAESADVLIDQLGITMTTPSRQLARTEMRQMLETALAELPTDYEEVIRLYDFEMKSAAEVAAIMQRSEGAIHMLRVRALDRLRRLLPSVSRVFSS